MEKWGYGKKDEAVQEGELDEGFPDRIQHAVTSTDNPEGNMPWSDAESREMDEEGVPLHPAVVRMYKRDKPGFRGDKRGWTGKYPPGFWDEDDGEARYAAYQQAAKGDVDEPMLDEMHGHPGKCCDTAHPDEEHEDYMARINIRLAEELPDVSVASKEEEDIAAEPEEEFGTTKIGGGEFRKASIATGKEAGAGGFTNKERGVVGDLQKKMVGAAEVGDIVTGKAIKLAKIFAAELDALIAKGK
tara:strand:- start:421 stop:1152 length:732 start_codon:yes stop_codon:yes gene_type:complete